jgi:hypothetical protein
MSSSDHLQDGLGINERPPSGLKNTADRFAMQSKFQEFERAGGAARFAWDDFFYA